MISQRFESLGISKSSIIYADNAEPKSIEELTRLGWNVKPADKGQGSVNAGIDMLLSKKVHYTESSKNIDTEAQNYLWKLNREKESTNEPIDAFNHAMDSVRYNVYSGANKKFVGFA
jgi:phage terminase large subunit